MKEIKAVIREKCLDKIIKIKTAKKASLPYHDDFQPFPNINQAVFKHVQGDLMKRPYKIMTMILFAVFILANNVYAMDKHDHGEGTERVDHSAHVGENIHNSKNEGYTLAYHLIDMKAQMAAMKDNPQAHSSGKMEMTHHLMVYLTDADGQPVKEAKVGYLVVNPDGTKQKLMSMHMKGGFGSDINLTQKGTYTIKTKVLSGDTKIMDQFSYEVN